MATRKRTVTRLEGMDDLERKLKRMTLDVQGEHLRVAAKAGAEIVREEASRRAPRSEAGSHGRAPGFLSENIESEVQWTRRQDKAEVHVGLHKDAYYGWFRETGTAFQTADPFLRPSVDSRKDDVVDEIRDVLLDRILTTAGGG